jgi:hypothetical protein
MSIALSTLRDDLSIKIGDYYHDTVTTALAANNYVICTRLNKITTADDYFNNWYVKVTSEENDGEVRKISDYDGGDTKITVYGDAFTTDGSDKATFEIHRYDPDQKDRAINNAGKELYESAPLFKLLADETVITGNILPPFIWTSSSALALYSTSNATIAKTTTGGLFRNGNNSALATVSAADGYLCLSSDDYPRLLDLMDKSVDFKGWAYPSTADDAFLTIYTVQADGTEQTLNSTTTCPASKFSLLELENQSLNDDITQIQLRMRVHTSDENAYFDQPRVIKAGIQDYMLPEDFQNGELCQVWIQSSSYSDDACDDIHPRYSPVFGWKTFTDGGYKYLHLPSVPSSNRKLKLVGYCPLEDDLSADTDTMSIDERHKPLLLAYAAYLLYEMKRGTVAGTDTGRYDAECLRWLSKAEMLKQSGLRMTPPSGQISWTI